MNNILLSTILLGVGATALIDLWSILRKRLFGIAALDYALLGRWIAYLPTGRFFHRPIGKSLPVQGERLIGWVAHYLVGILFAAALLVTQGTKWLHDPAVFPAMIVGIVSIAAPFFVMQPAMGLGLAARHAPRPSIARFHTIITHVIFGLGLYLSAQLALLVTA